MPQRETGPLPDSLYEALDSDVRTSWLETLYTVRTFPHQKDVGKDWYSLHVGGN